MNKFIFILLLSCLISCKKTNNQILSSDQMKEILLDLFIYLSIDKVDSKKTTEFVLKKYKISQEKFKKSSDYYTIHPEAYLKITDEVEKELEEKTKKIEEEIKKEIQVKKDLFNNELNALLEQKNKIDTYISKNPKKIALEKAKLLQIIEKTKKTINNLKDINEHSLKNIQSLINEVKEELKSYK